MRLNPKVAPEFERIIAKCLEKDRNLRYQHASEIRTDLQRMRRDTDSERVTASSKVGVESGFGKRWKVILFPPLWLYWRCQSLVTSYSHRATKLTDKDTIVLADFTNTTGDPVFDGTLRQGMAVQLEQSPFLSLISEQRILHTLSLMGQAPRCATCSRARP